MRLRCDNFVRINYRKVLNKPLSKVLRLNDTYDPGYYFMENEFPLYHGAIFFVARDEVVKWLKSN